MIPRVIGGFAIVAGIGFTGYCIRRWVLSQQWLVAFGLFLTGEAHHGRPVTDAGWFRHGLKALTPTGHATRWWYLPRWQRAAHRSSGVLAAVAAVTGFLIDPLPMTVAAGFTLLAAFAWSGLRLHGLIRTRKDRRTWLIPLHEAAHERMGIPRATAASAWIDVETDVNGAVQVVRIYPPKGWPADRKDQEWLVATTSTKLAIEGAEVIPALHGPRPQLTLKRSEPPPSYVGFTPDVLEQMAACDHNQIFLGFGKKGQPVKRSFTTDSPHLVINSGTGGTKSNLAGFILLQILLRGGIGLVLDAKGGLSYPWILKDEYAELSQLGNVGYARTTGSLHAGMAWLSDELARRNDVAFSGIDAHGKVRGHVGPTFFIIAEELNLAEDPLRAFWAHERDKDDPARSPAFTGLGSVAYAGRQVDMHLILIGQMVTAAVTGRRDSAVKENCGIKLMARYGKKSWVTMCDDTPMPPSPETVGRFQVVTGQRVQEVQTPELDPVAARQLVLGSDMSKLPPTMPRCLVTGIPALSSNPSSPALETVSTPLPVTGGPRLVGLREAVESGELHPLTTLGALKMHRFRDRQAFPSERGHRGAEKLYDLGELAAYDEARR